MPDENYAIDVRGLNKHFGRHHVVRDLALQVRRGEIFGFLGPNGSGKTTSIRMLCGLLVPDSGSGTCLGLDVIRQPQEIKRRVGYMTQRFSLWEDLTIQENLEFIARMYGMKNIKTAVAASLSRLGLSDRRKQLAGQLSGGWKQRLALASCMLHEPELLLLDEPTAGVDPKARRDFWDQIHGLAASGMSVLVSTHYMDEAERCHKLAYIAWGKLLATGTAAEVVAGCGLTAWEVSGSRLSELAAQLRSLAGVDQVTAFGNVLHVVGRDGQKLFEAITPVQESTPHRWQPIEPSLEDAFISLMASADQVFET
ncbi:MAG: ABC transporter ATP-binding protein [Rhodocyclaceae bacterium]|nr:ABC transporter ATP-binding protein [Rhodocyclaceae bacterium]